MECDEFHVVRRLPPRPGVANVACPVVRSYDEPSFLCTAAEALLHWRAAAEFEDVLARATHFGVGVWQHQTQREVRNGEQVSPFLVSVVEVTN